MAHGRAPDGIGGDGRETLLRKAARVLSHHEADRTGESPAIQPWRPMMTPCPWQAQARVRPSLQRYSLTRA
jgi:hypothetical protein